MLKHIIDFYKVSAPAPCNGDFLPEQKQRLKRLQWSTFLAATLGYSMYYVCRLSLNVVYNRLFDDVQAQPAYIVHAVSKGCCQKGRPLQSF